MASLNDRTAGQDFEGNGPSSFGDRDRDYFTGHVSDWGTREGDAEKQVAIDAAIAQIEAAFGPGNPHHAKWVEFYAERDRKARAA